MTMTTYRNLTLAEIYPMAHKQDLLKKQSEYFVNKIITNGNLESGYENIPVDFPQKSNNIPLIIDTKPPQFFIFTYLKNNWKPMLVFGAVVAVSVTAYHLLKQKKEKKSNETKNPKTIYYNLPKKSM
jgi:hypothetical protein